MSAVQEMNDKIFAALADPVNTQKANDAVNEYTRTSIFGLVLPFTRMPMRGFLQQIMPPMPAYAVTDLAAWGWPYNPYDVSVFKDVALASHLHEHGVLYYEMLERRLAEEDYRLRLLLRLVPKHEWRFRASWERRERRWTKQSPTRPGLPTRAESYTYFLNTMCSLVAQVREVARRKQSV